MIIPFFLLCLSLIGLLDTAYLSYTHLFGSAACGSGSGCDRVLTSAYADIGGLPLSVMGLGFYAALALMAWRAQETENRDAAVRAVSLGALAGVPPTLFLLYVQAAIVEAWCPFCLTSAALVFLLLLLSFADRRRRENLRPLVGRLPTAGAAFPVFLAFSLPPLVFVPLQAGVQEAVVEAQSPP
ncbi:MAG: vitamin K epoxide reductase family protein, partial [Gemmatimonadetes bacterium]|nr:vitamin K epoxide reductase family protein [Gemmatimonadota bacterium]